MIAALLLGMMTLSLGAPALALPNAAVKPAGCHSPEAPTPAPRPASYECCAAGHIVAVPAAEFAIHPPVAALATRTEADTTVGASSRQGAAAFSNPFLDGSPGLTPLRV